MRSSLFIFCTLSVQLAASLTGPLLRHANADDTAGRAETQQAIISAWPHPSLDTYPVGFSIGGIHYRIPRNYLTTMENWKGGPQYIVTVAVNLPDLKPYSTETLPCFTTKAPERPPGCELLSFRINVPGGPPAEEVFQKYRKFFHSQSPTSGPAGLEKYEFGPPDARTEVYRKIEDGRTRLYFCHYVGSGRERNGLCQPDSDSAASGAEIKFFFSPKQLNEIADIDANIRKLVEGFTVSGDQK